MGVLAREQLHQKQDAQGNCSFLISQQDPQKEKETDNC
jgi:hypothetical protein